MWQPKHWGVAVRWSPGPRQGPAGCPAHVRTVANPSTLWPSPCLQQHMGCVCTTVPSLPQLRGQKEAEGNVVRLFQRLWRTVGDVDVEMHEGCRTTGTQTPPTLLGGHSATAMSCCSEMLAARMQHPHHPGLLSEMQSPREKALNCNLFGVLAIRPPHSGSALRHRPASPASQTCRDGALSKDHTKCQCLRELWHITQVSLPAD